MKTIPSAFTAARAATVVLAALLIGGCLQERLAWSPDGRHAAIVTAEGLHLAGADGKISPLLAPGVYQAAWLPDSQSLVLARRKPVKNFAELSAALGPTRAKLLAAKAESVWGRLRDLPRGEAFSEGVAREIGDDLEGIVVYLREQPHHLAALREKMGPEWKKEDETKPADLHEVVVARLSGEKLLFGSPLFIGLPGIGSLRPAPGGQAVAFTMQPELSPYPDNGISLLVAPTDASAPAVIAATQGATHPDWTPDGRSLVFFKAAGSVTKGDDLRLGALVQREVLDASGRIQLAKESTDLAGLIFHQQNRVRCLRDGRVLFNASPITLPTTGRNDDGREQLFVVTRGPEATVRPLIPRPQLEQLPKTLSFFEVSPDDRLALFSNDDGEVWLLTLATGAVERVAGRVVLKKDESKSENLPAPVWRAAGEYTFLRNTTSGPAPVELVLRRGATDTVLSRSWDPSVLRKLIE